MATKNMATKKNTKTKSSKSTIVKRVIIAVLVVALLAFVAFAGYTIYKFFAGDGTMKTVAIKINGKMYKEDAGGVELLSGDEFEVYILSGEGDYTVEVVSNVTEENDFEFTVGVDTYKWSETTERTFTGGFKFTQTDKGFKAEYGKLSEIISSAYGGRSVTVDEEAHTGVEIFALVIKYGDESMRLTFAIGRQVENIEINPPEIIIGGENKGENGGVADEKDNETNGGTVGEGEVENEKLN